MVELFSSLARYNRWMNGKIYTSCAQLTEDERTRDRGAFFRSIHGTLNHLLYGDRAWMNRLAARCYEHGRADDTLFDDFEELRSVRVTLDNEIIDWVDTLQEKQLLEYLAWTSMIDGKTRNQPKWLLLSHMFNHGTHHRGQISTLLYQIGVDIGSTDLPWMPTDE